MKPHSRFIGVSATPKPVRSALRVSVTGPPFAEQRLQPAGRQVDVEEAHEEQEHRQRRAPVRSQGRAPSACCRSRARRSANSTIAAIDEAGVVDQRHLREQSRADPGEGARSGRRARRAPPGRRERARASRPVNTSSSSQQPSTISPAETTFGMKFGPMRGVAARLGQRERDDGREDARAPARPATGSVQHARRASTAAMALLAPGRANRGCRGCASCLRRGRS